MKERIIDWMYQDMIDTFPWLGEPNAAFSETAKAVAEDRGTKLYLHLFADKGDVEEYYADDSS